MNNFLLIPDSFKGTMSSRRVCDIMSAAIKENFSDAVVRSIPVADGGEGSVDAFLSSMGGRKKYVRVKDPYFNDIDSFYGVLGDGRTAVIEMAACAGLPLAGANCDARFTTTYGVGQLMRCAIEAGCNRIIMGLGGSATNDGGCGAAAALGVKFEDGSGQGFVPVGGTMHSISRIDMSSLYEPIKGIEITTMCDIDNPLYGKNGAAYVFAPQKGATPEVVSELDFGLRHLAEIMGRDIGLDCSNMAGAGAAGGMGCGMAAFFRSELKMGIEVVLDTVGFDDLAAGADFIFTGEGRIDSQSLRGKVVIGVARRARKWGLPVIAVVGDIGEDIEPVYSEGVSAVFSINRVAVPFNEAKSRAERDLHLTVCDIVRFMDAIKKSK